MPVAEKTFSRTFPRTVWYTTGPRRPLALAVFAVQSPSEQGGFSPFHSSPATCREALGAPGTSQKVKFPCAKKPKYLTFGICSVLDRHLPNGKSNNWVRVRILGPTFAQRQASELGLNLGPIPAPSINQSFDSAGRVPNSTDFCTLHAVSHA